MGDLRNLNLPPGFRFYPSDEELIVHFLHRKAAVLPCNPNVIPDLDLYPYDPWDLNDKAMCEGRKWYFYSRRTTASCRRITRSGYWQVTGVEDPIYSNNGQKLIGTKKHYNFYINESPYDISTNWIMQEYRLVLDSSSSRSSSRKRSSKTDYSTWVVCRVYEEDDDGDDDERELSCLDEVFLSLDDLDEISLPN